MLFPLLLSLGFYSTFTRWSLCVPVSIFITKELHFTEKHLTSGLAAKLKHIAKRWFVYVPNDLDAMCHFDRRALYCWKKTFFFNGAHIQTVNANIEFFFFLLFCFANYSLSQVEPFSLYPTCTVRLFGSDLVLPLALVNSCCFH